MGRRRAKAVEVHSSGEAIRRHAPRWCTERYGDGSFADTHHLNERGAQQLTSDVARALAGETLPTCTAPAPDDDAT